MLLRSLKFHRHRNGWWPPKHRGGVQCSQRCFWALFPRKPDWLFEAEAWELAKLAVAAGPTLTHALTADVTREAPTRQRERVRAERRSPACLFDLSHGLTQWLTDKSLIKCKIRLKPDDTVRVKQISKHLYDRCSDGGSSLGSAACRRRYVMRWSTDCVLWLVQYSCISLTFFHPYSGAGE